LGRTNARNPLPGKARQWWTTRHAAVPAIETLETHIIGGAIIPLWQRFKTHEETRLRVVRVTTDDGQRIVGIRIPPEQVGVVVRALGSTRDLREPDEIFSGVLDEGEEVHLVSGLKLRFVAIGESHPGNGSETIAEPAPASAIEPSAKPVIALTAPSPVFVSGSEPGRDMSEPQLAFDF